MDGDDDGNFWEPVVPPGRRNHDNDDHIVDGPQIVEEAIRNADGSYEGGEAIQNDHNNNSGGGRLSTDCDLALFLECTETIDIAPDHKILQPGVTVTIGLDKSTKLSAVFERYCEFCNDHSGSNSTDTSVHMTDLEFVHCVLLNTSDTAEASALMKNDRIYVRRIRANERAAELEEKRIQRESDREYFRQLRMLLPEKIGTKNCDVLFDCRGKLVDENGLNQEVLRSGVRGHSAILSKRCKWLGRMIQCARDELGRRSVITIPENQDIPNDEENNQQYAVAVADDGRLVSADSAISPNVASIPIADKDDDADDDSIEVLSYPLNRSHQPHLVQNNHHNIVNSGGANEIENDDDEDDLFLSKLQPADVTQELENSRPESPVISTTSGSNSMLWVTLPNHPPEAVKLLLEYCYTNRVVSLGQNAFEESCRTKSDHLHPHAGPVSPYSLNSHGSRRWPNNGLPTVSFTVALAGIALAEEAGMPRLSLMCEVAASQLVTMPNFVDALGLCTTQQNLTGNALPRLRQAAMDVVLRSGVTGVVNLSRSPTFKRALEARSSAIVPSLLVGTMEAVTSATPKPHVNDPTSGCKRELSEMTKETFDDLDREDMYRRETERRKRRIERWKERGHTSDGSVFCEEDMESMMMLDPLASMWSPEPSKMSLKRMSHHLGGVLSRGNGGGKAGNDLPTNRLGYAVFGTTRHHGRPRSSGTRRVSGRSRTAANELKVAKRKSRRS